MLQHCSRSRRPSLCWRASRRRQSCRDMNIAEIWYDGGKMLSQHGHSTCREDFWGRLTVFRSPRHPKYTPIADQLASGASEEPEGNFGKARCGRPTLARFKPSSPDFARVWPKPSHIWQTSGQARSRSPTLGRIRATSGQARANFGKHRPRSANADPDSPNSKNCARNWANAEQHWPRSGPNSAETPRDFPSLRILPFLHPCRCLRFILKRPSVGHCMIAVHVKGLQQSFLCLARPLLPCAK